MNRKAQSSEPTQPYPQSRRIESKRTTQRDEGHKASQSRSSRIFSRGGIITNRVFI